MSRILPWYKRDVNAWRSGTRGMSLELRGFYSECLDNMWDRQGPIEKDEKKLACLLCCNPRSVRKLLPQLIALGKIVETPEGYMNPRMIEAISEANSDRVATKSKRNLKPIETELPSNSAPIPAQFQPKVPNNPMFSTRDLEEDKEREIPPNPHRGNGGKSLWQTALNPQSDFGVEWTESGALILVNGTRQHWLEQFAGDAKALNLALVEAAGEIQPSSTRPLKAQVERKLAQIARLEHGSNKRAAARAPRPFAEQAAAAERAKLSRLVR